MNRLAANKGSKSMKVFRFLSADSLIKTIDDLTLKFSVPTTFNDPYDNHVPVTYILDESLLKSMIKKSLKNFVEGSSSFKQDCLFENMLISFVKNNNDFVERIINDIDNVVDWIYSNIKEGKGTTQEYFFNFKRPSEKDVICCFSKCNDSLLMWGHYADNHKGGVVEFDLPDNYADKFFTVKYSDKVPNIDAVNLLFGTGSSTDVLELLSANYRTKALCWEYEKEIRAVFYISENCKNPGISDENMHHIQMEKRAFIPFAPEFIKGIYLGVNFSKEDLKKFMECYNSISLNSPVYKAKLKKDSFGLDFEPVDLMKEVD